MTWYLNFSSIETIERIIEGLFSLYTAVVMILAVKTLYKDRNQILNFLDKLTFFIAICNSICLTVYFFIFVSSFLLITIRTFRLIQDFLICAIFLIMLYKEKAEFLTNLAIFQIFLVCILWFCGVNIGDHKTDYDCNNYIWIVFSGLNLILSTLNIYSGYNSYSLMKMKFFNQRNIRLSETNETVTRQQFQEQVTEKDLNSTKFSLYALMGSSFISIFTQFMWDYFLHIKSVSQEQCAQNYHSHDFGSFILCLILKISTFIPSIWGIYYVFYYKNRNNFNTAKECEERSLSVFYDFRSDYLDEETNDLEDERYKN